MSVSGFRFVELEGSHRERGQVHGETFRPLIHELLGRWKSEIAEAIKLDPDAHLEAFVRDTHLVRAAERWTPELLEEIAGIGEGAGVPFPIIFAWQCQGALPWYERPRVLELAQVEHCTSLGVAGQAGIPTLLAQNLDLPRLREGYALVQHHKLPETDLEMLVIGSVGSIGDSGLNNQGIGLVENTVSQLDHRMDGLGDFFVARGIIIRRTFDAAASFVRTLDHACGHNYVIGAPDRVADFECSAHKVVWFSPLESGNRVWHSNHPVANDEQGQWKGFLAALPEARRQEILARSTSPARLAGAEKRLKNEKLPVTMESIQALLCSHDEPICVHNDRAFSASAIIHVLSDTPELYITDGPPCSNEYHRFSF